MKIKLHKLTSLIFLTSILFVSCVEEFWPDLENNNENILVVEGKVTNKPGPYTIKISKTGSLDSIPYGTSPEFDFQAYEGAIVEIIDIDGNTEALTEVEPGIYKTAEAGMQGEIGNSYMLRITKTNGEVLESSYEKLVTPAEIENVDVVEEEVYSYINNEEIFDEGIRLKVTSKETTEESGYLMWELEETYEYRSLYEIENIYMGNFIGGHWGDQIHPPYNIPTAMDPDSLYYCWKTDIVKGVYGYNTAELTTSKVIDLPLNFVSYDDERLRYKYSVLVKQYSISENAFSYIEKLIDQNSDQDNMYTSQPYQIRGNIVNTSNNSEPILGYFMTASTKENERVYFKPDVEYTRDTIKICNIWAWDELSYGEREKGKVLNWIIYHSKPTQWPIYLTTAWVCTNCDPIPPPPYARIYQQRYAVVDDGCIDCRLRKTGGTLEKPDYWDWDE